MFLIQPSDVQYANHSPTGIKDVRIDLKTTPGYHMIPDLPKDLKLQKPLKIGRATMPSPKMKPPCLPTINLRKNVSFRGV